MNRRRSLKGQVGVCVLLSLVPHILCAAAFQKTLELSAYIQLTVGRTPIVHSYAAAALVTDQGARIYNQQVILNHRIFDLSAGADRFLSETFTNIGYASNSSGDLVGNYATCYYSEMRAGASNLNVSEILFVPQKCIPDLYKPPPHVPEENCPVILDLARNGFHLSGPEPAVRFDIDADGALDNIAWTQAGGDDAFLCMDRNHNGVIDNGSELFGYATPLISGQPAKVGYRALAELDTVVAGGNSDGIIDSRDLLFRELRVWIDQNRDGVSQPGELFSLEQVGVAYLEYDYVPLQIRDSYGNLFRYVSRVGMRTAGGAVTSWPTFDVIFGER